MTNTEWFLIVMLLLQQAFWMFHTQKLSNKLMSRNYAEYLQAQASAKNTAAAPPLPPREPVEDLGALSSFGGPL